MKKRSFAAFCMRLRMRFLAWRAQRRGELPPDEVFFYRFNQREGLNTRKRAFGRRRRSWWKWAERSLAPHGRRACPRVK